MALLDGKQIKDLSIPLEKLSSTGIVTFTSSATMSFGAGATLRRDTSDILVGSDVVNKEYVDAIAAGLSPRQQTVVIYNGDVASQPGYVYNNGVSGVGSTLAFSFSSIDGINSASFSVGDRIIMNSTTDKFVNGVYDYVTFSTLSRSADFAGASTSTISGGEYAFVKQGNTNADTGWVISSPDTTATIGTTDIVWVQFSAVPSSTPTSLSVSDYNTGITYSNIESIIFRGAVLTVPGGTAIGVLADGTAPGTVTVWIPKPTYVGYFTPTTNISTTNRYISTPTANTYSSVPGNTGSYATGNWNTSTDFSASTVRPTVGNAVSSITGFTEAQFACFDTNTTLHFELFDSDGSEIRGVTISLSGAGTFNSTPTGLSITVNSFTADSDRYKADVSGVINLSTIFPNGGKFTGWRITHNNGEGPGNAGLGVYQYSNLSGYFFDNDLSPSSANISGTSTYDESTPNYATFSGVAFYDTGSSFGFTVSGVNLLNDITFPSTPQVDIVTNFGIPTISGHSNGTKGYSQISGWSLAWDNTGLTFSSTGSINSSAGRIPGFSTNNTIAAGTVSRFTANVYDWSLVDSEISGGKNLLIDTIDPTGANTYNNDFLDSENDRLSTSGVLGGSGSNAFNSNLSLKTSGQNTDELQYIFNRVIYPQTNFNQFYPIVNTTNDVNYTGLTGVDKVFDIYTDTSSVPVTTGVTFSGYRWHTSKYGADSLYTTFFANGVFTLDSNFLESYLHYDGTTGLAGTGDLVILIGVNSTGNTSLYPDKFLFVSGDPTVYGGVRYNPLTAGQNLNGGTKKIAYSQGNLNSAGVNTKKVWLFIGYKNTTTGKNLYMTQIGFSTPAS